LDSVLKIKASHLFLLLFTPSRYSSAFCRKFNSRKYNVLHFHFVS